MGAAWAEDGGIVVSAGVVNGLVRVPESGVAHNPSPSSAIPEGNSHRWPQVLPDRKGVLFAAGSAAAVRGSRLVVQSPTGARKEVYRGATFPLSGDGY